MITAEKAHTLALETHQIKNLEIWSLVEEKIQGAINEGCTWVIIPQELDSLTPFLKEDFGYSVYTFTDMGKVQTRIEWQSL